MNTTSLSGLLIAAGLTIACNSARADMSIPMHMVNADGKAKAIGQVSVSESPYGAVFTPKLTGLPPGLHGFHLHENPSCEPAQKDGKPTAAEGAGDHYDPKKTKVHGTPWGEGHAGDLPPLYVGSDGLAEQAVLAPRLKLAEVKGRALMVHEGGDNHADHPKPLGGGAGRVACGVAP